MTTWTDKSYNATLDASNKLLRAAHDLNEAMGAGGGATSPEDVLRALRQIIGMTEAMRLTVETGKVRALLGQD